MPVEVGNWGGGKIWRVTAGVFPSNSYICEVAGEGACILIDVGLDGPTIDGAIIGLGLRPQHIFCTHGHFDHAGSAAYFQKKYGIGVTMHKADARTVKASNFLLMAFKVPQRVEEAEIGYIDGEYTTHVGSETLRFLPAPGHTPGSCVIQFGKAMFTGDTIYSRGVGLSQLPGENAATLRGSILALWDRMTADMTIYPGHGNAADGLTIKTKNTALLKFLGMNEGKAEDS